MTKFILTLLDISAWASGGTLATAEGRMEQG